MSVERAKELFDLYSIPTASRGHEHCRHGWVNVCCPFCGDGNYHLGYNADSGYFSCYRCGFKNAISVLHELLDCGVVEAKRLNRLFLRATSSTIEAQEHLVASTFKLPTSGSILENLPAYTYLRKRLPHLCKEEFKQLITACGITYTDSHYADNWKYANKIVFPNILDGRMVSFQVRAYTKQNGAPYRTADPSEELVFHKDFLWGIDRVPYSKIIVNEGVMDALTIGDGAVHTHGVMFTEEQVRCLYAFDHVYIAYDMDLAGKLAAKRLAAALCHRTKVTIVKLSGHDVNTCGKQEINDLKGLIQ